MKEYETLYTVNDVAAIVGVTTRSIRNYMKSGMLTGRRVGGQWRFTQADIDKLFKPAETIENDGKSEKRNDTALNETSKSTDTSKYKLIDDFLHKERQLSEGNIQICAIADYYCGHRIEAERKAGNLRAIVNGMNRADDKFEYEYIRSERKARFIIEGHVEFVEQVIELIKS